MRWRFYGIPGFTLLELLVVMAIVSVLTAMLLPVLGRARARAEAVVCLSNLRQWGVATQLYAADHSDLLPPEGTPNPGERSTNMGWYIQLPLQMNLPRYHDMPWRTNAEVHPGRTVWLCPTNPRRSNGRNLFHYCLNEHINGTGEENSPVVLATVPSPSTAVWLFDTKNLPAVGYWGFVHTNLHAGGAQLTFLDGHARRFRREEYWDDRTGRARTDNLEIQWVP
jgi:prepilin-type N-terminal cleavage/methylation domain-containing protein/prepilin-type processing-associated H-X9-DG protein